MFRRFLRRTLPPVPTGTAFCWAHVADIVEGHILIGCSRLINALLLIICIAIGLSATLLMVKDGLL